jgi:hypothetical protein
MSAGFVVFVGVVILGLVLFTLWDRSRSGDDGAEEPVEEEMARLARGTVEAAQDAFGTRLDYSVASIGKVERILGRLHDEHQVKAFFPERVAAEADRWGAYVGEVARRVRGGRWQRDSAHLGKGTFPLVFGEEDEIYPCAWCFRRITNGPEDDVLAKFRLSVTERPEEAGLRKGR